MSHLFIFDKDETLLDILDSECYYDDTYKRQLNGEWSFIFYVKFEHLKHLEKPNKIGFYDKEEQFQLFKIQDCEDVFGNEESFEIYCVHDSYALGELIIEDKRIIGGTARDAVMKCIENSTYSVGNIADLGEKTLNFYFISRLQGLRNIVETYGGELDFRFELDESKTRIIKRYVDLKYRLGEDTGLRFTFDLNLQGVTRNRSSEGHFTVLYGRGKSLEVGDGYSRRLTFDEVAWNKPTNPLNKSLGDKFLVDPDAVARWGRIEGIYENDSIEDAEELLKATHKALEDAKEPKISYSATVEDLSNLSGYEHLKFVLGDSIVIQDEKYQLNNEARIVSEEYSIKNKKEPKQVTLGYIQMGISDSLSGGSITNPTITAPTEIEIDDTNFPNTLPSTPILRAKGLFSSIVLEWTFESKTYYNYEIYASEIQHFNPDPSNLIFRGKASSLLHEVKPSETWYYRARAINTHGEVTEMSEEVSATSFKISDATEYFEDVAIKEALIDTLSLDRGWFGQLKGQFLDVKNLVVTDGNNVRTMYVDDFGRVHMNVSELKINSKDVLNSEQAETLIEAKAGEISLEVAKKEISNMQFGVENLLLGTSDYTPSTIWHNSDSNWHDDTFKGCKVYYVSHDWAGMKYYIKDLINRHILQAGVTYTISCYAIASAPGVYGGFYSDGFGFAQVGELSTSWTQYSFTFTPTQEQINSITDTGKIRFEPHKLSGTGHRVYVACYKLEKGSKATDYVKSSEDLPTTTQMNSAINQKADSITSEVVKIENSMAIDNLLANGNFTNGFNNWEYRDYERPVSYEVSANTSWVMKGKNALLLRATNHPQGVDSGFVQTVDVKPHTDYTFTGYMASHRAEGMVIIKDNHGAWLVYDKTNPDVDNYTGGQDISKWKRVRIVYNSGNRNKLHLHLALAKSNNNGHVWFHDFMVSEGINDLCWKPSEKETRTKFAQLSDRITSTVTSIGKVDGKVDKAQSQIDQQARQIASKVNENDFSSLVQQNGHSVMASINNSRGSMGVGIDMNGLYGYNNGIATFRLTEGKFHAYDSRNGRHMGYFGTQGDDLRATLYGTNTFSIFSDDRALLLRARYERDARYGNATLDMCGGINFIHKPGQDVGTNQILLGNDDRSDTYGLHNMSIRCWNSLGFQDNWGLTHMFFDVRRGRIIMKGGLYQNTATPPRTFSMNFDGEDEVYASGFTRSQAVDSVMNLKTGVYVDNDGQCCSAIYSGHDELITTKYQDEDGYTTTHLNTNALNASLVVTCQEQQKLIEALQKELNEIKEYLKAS